MDNKEFFEFILKSQYHMPDLLYENTDKLNHQMLIILLYKLNDFIVHFIEPNVILVAQKFNRLLFYNRNLLESPTMEYYLSLLNLELLPDYVQAIPDVSVNDVEDYGFTDGYAAAISNIAYLLQDRSDLDVSIHKIDHNYSVYTGILGFNISCCHYDINLQAATCRAMVWVKLYDAIMDEKKFTIYKDNESNIVKRAISSSLEEV